MIYKTYRIGDICSMVKGSYPTMNTEPGEYPLVVTAEYRRSANTYQLEGPAVCVPLISSTGHGDAALHRVHYQEGKFALANLLVALIPNDLNLCDARYLYQLLMAKKDQYFVPLMSGTANVSLKIQDIAGVEIPLPSIEEQHRIVTRIEELATRIEEARGLRRGAGEETEKLLDAELDRVFATIGVKFDITVIGQAGGFVTSGPRGWGNYYNESGHRRLIRVENVVNRELDLSTAAKVAVPPYEGDIERSKVQIGDVLITITGAAIGRVGVVRSFDMPCHVSQHVALMRVPSTISPYYLYWYLRAPTFGRSQTEGKTYGATKPGINLTNLRMLQIATPPIDQQRAIVTYFDKLEAKVDSLKRLQSETSAELDTLLPSILDKAFKGEL